MVFALAYPVFIAVNGQVRERFSTTWMQDNGADVGYRWEQGCDAVAPTSVGPSRVEPSRWHREPAASNLLVDDPIVWSSPLPGSVASETPRYVVGFAALATKWNSLVIVAPCSGYTVSWKSSKGRRAKTPGSGAWTGKFDKRLPRRQAEKLSYMGVLVPPSSVGTTWWLEVALAPGGVGPVYLALLPGPEENAQVLWDGLSSDSWCGTRPAEP